MAQTLCKILTEGGTGEIVEKKSRFIAALCPVCTEEEAAAFIREKKKEHWDARHNCYAYVIGPHQECTRCSDDGEPAQTAGRPMLDVLLKEEITNAVVVVTRYFGGILLGTGGLVRAYQGAVSEGLSHCTVVSPQRGRRMHVVTDYHGFDKVSHLLQETQISPEHVDYGAEVALDVLVPEEKVEALGRAVADATGGEAQIVWGDPLIFAAAGEGVLIFEEELF